MPNYRAGQHLRFADHDGQVRIGTVAYMRGGNIVMTRPGHNFTFPIKPGDVIAVLPCDCADHFTLTCDECGKGICPRATQLIENGLRQRFCCKTHRDRYDAKMRASVRSLTRR